MDAEDRLRLDYEQTTGLYRTLVDIRFKLLAIVPTLSGLGVGLFGKPRPPIELMAIGLLGLVATSGILLYELRNTQVRDAIVRRASELERLLSLPSAGGGEREGGLFSERPTHPIRVFGLVGAVHERGLGLVYGAALAGWSYLVAWGFLRAVDAGAARKTGAIVGLAVGLLVVAEVERLGRRERPAGGPKDARTRSPRG